jgi:hypothetical protein
VVVVLGVLLALLATRATGRHTGLNCRAEDAEIGRGLAGEDAARGVACVSAVVVEANATDQLPRVRLAETGVGAAGARSGTVEALFDATHERDAIEARRLWMRLEHLLNCHVLSLHRVRPKHSVRQVAIVHYASWMSPPATLLIWFQLRSPELAEDFERLMTEDRDNVRGSLDTFSDWRLTRPADVPGQSIGQADYVLIAEIVEVDRFEQQASEHVQRLEEDLEHLVSSRGMLVVRPVL